jgi:transposase
MQLEVKTILNGIQPLAGFVYRDIRLGHDRLGRPERVEITLAAHSGIKPKCSQCQKPAPGYDQLPPRTWQFVPLWGLMTWFVYAARRVQCPEHGVVVEHLPWNEGKRRVTRAMMVFLAQWARRLSWQETARTFHTSWESVYRSVEWFVEWGLAHRILEGVRAIGVDEIHWGKGKGAARFLTVIYQIDSECRRLLWVGPRRTQATLRRGLAELGPEVIGGLRFVCSDMWQPYLKVLAAKASQALHILDRFHITSHLNQAVDQVRRAESGRLRATASPQAARLKSMRWKLLRRGHRVRGKARSQLHALAASKLATARAWILKETFEPFWKYRSVTWASYFLDVWTQRALRSRLAPMQRVARTLRSHQPLLLNWFRAKGEISNAATEGLNNKIRVVTRRSYGFRTYKAMEIALYHNLGKLPEPDQITHRFC